MLCSSPFKTSNADEADGDGAIPSTARAGDSDGSSLSTPCDGETNVTNEGLPPAVNINVPANFLIVHSTTPYRAAKHSIEKGSWFLEELCEALFDTQGSEINLLELLTETNARVSRRESVNSRDPQKSGNKCTTILSHRLITDLVFRSATAQLDEEMPNSEMWEYEGQEITNL